MTRKADSEGTKKVNVHLFAIAGKAKKRKGRKPKGKTSKTSGVTVLQRHGGVWALRWTDPDTGKRRQRDLTFDEGRTVEERTTAARRLSEALRTRKLDLGQGGAQANVGGAGRRHRKLL